MPEVPDGTPYPGYRCAGCGKEWRTDGDDELTDFEAYTIASNHARSGDCPEPDIVSIEREREVETDQH